MVISFGELMVDQISVYYQIVLSINDRALSDEGIKHET